MSNDFVIGAIFLILAAGLFVGLVSCGGDPVAEFVVPSPTKAPVCRAPGYYDDEGTFFPTGIVCE